MKTRSYCYWSTVFATVILLTAPVSAQPSFGGMRHAVEGSVAMQRLTTNPDWQMAVEVSPQQVAAIEADVEAARRDIFSSRTKSPIRTGNWKAVLEAHLTEDQMRRYSALTVQSEFIDDRLDVFTDPEVANMVGLDRAAQAELRDAVEQERKGLEQAQMKALKRYEPIFELLENPQRQLLHDALGAGFFDSKKSDRFLPPSVELPIENAFLDWETCIMLGSSVFCERLSLQVSAAGRARVSNTESTISRSNRTLAVSKKLLEEVLSESDIRRVMSYRFRSLARRRVDKLFGYDSFCDHLKLTDMQKTQVRQAARNLQQDFLEAKAAELQAAYERIIDTLPKENQERFKHLAGEELFGLEAFQGIVYNPEQYFQ